MTESEITRLMSSSNLHDMNPRDTITQIKAAAIRQFEALDGRMKIHSTEYFNHSFSPDLVLTWKAGREAERYVYLRSASEPEDLADDVRRLADQKPIVLGLYPLYVESGDSGAIGSELNSLAHERDTLVTDPGALASIAESRQNRPVNSLFSTALTQAGRGLVDSYDAEVATEVISIGFDAAREMGADSVLKAVAAVQDHLTAPFASRFNRILQAVWIGSGGRADLFPHGQVDLTAGVEDDALEFLLDLDVIDDDVFWRRIGRNISVRQLAKVSPRQPNENLQRLVKANLDHLAVRACRIQDREEQIEEAGLSHPWWLTERQTLALRGPSWVAYVAEKAEELGEIEGSVTRGVTISDVLDRAGETVLSSMQMSDGTYDLDLSSSTHQDVIHSAQLGAVAGSFGPAVRVLRARAMSGNRQIACDFTKSSASTTTSNMVLLSDLLRTSIPLLRAMTEEELAALFELLTSPPDPDQLPFPSFATSGPPGVGYLRRKGSPPELPSGHGDRADGSPQEP